MSAEKENGSSEVIIEKGGIHDFLTVLMANDPYGIPDAKREALPDGRSRISATVCRARLIEVLRELNMRPVSE